MALVVFTISAYAQIDISGIVTDTDGEALIGVNIQIRGSTTGTTTDFEGNFQLDNVAEDATIILSYVGYETKTVPVEGQTQMNIVLTSNVEMLDEIVVIGYGTVQDRKSTRLNSSHVAISYAVFCL